MAEQLKRKGGKKNRKHGRSQRKPKTARYKNLQRRYKNKLKRVLKSNGEAAARAYAANRPCHTKRYECRGVKRK